MVIDKMKSHSCLAACRPGDKLQRALGLVRLVRLAIFVI